MSENETQRGDQTEAPDVAAIVKSAVAEAVEATVKAMAEAKPEPVVNDPGISVPAHAKHADAWKYDNYPAGDLAATLEVVGSTNRHHFEERLALVPVRRGHSQDLWRRISINPQLWRHPQQHYSHQQLA